MRPELPPKAGYVEVQDEQGNHIYKPTASTIAKLKNEQAMKDIQADMDSVIVDQEYRLTLLELGVN